MTILEKKITKQITRMGNNFDSGDVYEIAKNYTNSKQLSILEEIINYFGMGIVPICGIVINNN